MAGHKDSDNPAEALFKSPIEVTWDQPSGCLFVSDWGNHRIRKISHDGKVTTVAGTGNSGLQNGSGEVAEFRRLSQLVCFHSKREEGSSPTLYVCDDDNHCIRQITPTADGYEVSILAGSSNSQPGDVDGLGVEARFDHPWGLEVDPDGSIYVADAHNHKIRVIKQDGTVSTLAGPDVLGDALPDRLLLDSDGGRLYFTDHQTIKMVQKTETTEVKCCACCSCFPCC